MYKVLYRKYRPQFFSDVIGQPQVTVTLQNELMQGRVAHAYLFTGSRGTGKTTCAKILARAVNCLDPQNGDPCGKCAMCRGLEDGSILDVVEIDAASNNGVDSIRSLIEESNFTPASAKYRVYIIDEVHMLSTAAFNALLKTLEEPPAHVIFILATTEVHKLLPTILSRCQRFDFRRIDPGVIAQRLMEIALKEEAELDRDAALLIARVADGAMRDALSLLDQCLGRERHVTLSVVSETAGVAARDYLSKLADAILQRDAAKALLAVDSLYRDSKDMNRLCEELAEYFRGLMLLKTMKDASALLSVSEKEQEAMTKQALAMPLSAILHSLDTLEDTLQKMRYANPRTELEMALVRLCSAEVDTSLQAILRRLEALENGTGLTRSREMPAKAETVPPPESLEESKPAPASQEPFAPDSPSLEREPSLESEANEEKAPVKEESRNSESAEQKEPSPKKSSSPALSIEELSASAQRFLDWPEILEVIKGSTKSVAMAFSNSSAYINGEYMLIEAPELAFELLKRPEQRDRMREAIRHVTGRVYKLGPYRKPSKEPEKEDFLGEVERRARDLGIDIEEEE